MAKLLDLPFNTKLPTIMHIDLNSCFATIEQQANPFWRDKPLAVAAYNSPAGCIVAPSVEAKRFGIKTGMRVKDGKMLCPELIVVTPDPWKYRSIHLQFRKIIESYTDHYAPKSIDEFVLDLEGAPAYKKGMVTVAQEIKDRIRKEVGEFLRVSIGIAPNRFLAKQGAGLHKPDGLDIIDRDNYLDIYSNLSLTDLTGIKTANTIRLNNCGIYTVLDFYNGSIATLRSAFQSICGYYWYLRLHGWEIDDVEFARHSYGNSFAIPKPLEKVEDLAPILMKLIEKTGMRLRTAGYRAKGVHLALVFRDWDYWHKGVTLPDYIFDSRDIYKMAFRLLQSCPQRKPVREIAESVFHLEKHEHSQLGLFEDTIKKEKLVEAVDTINKRWGNFVITPAMMMGTEDLVIDRVAFGGIKELEEIVIGAQL